jgi:hypothetical protein
MTEPLQLPYKLRVSARARRVQIRVRPYVGLEVVVPKRFPRHQVGRILQQHQAWITAQLDRHAASFDPAPLPDQLSLALTDERFDIEYDYAGKPGVTRLGQSLRITLPDPQADPAQAIGLLRGWVRQRARAVLCPRLRELANAFGMDYRRCSLRSQKSRWGSCSSNGTISLNDQLLFMPADTVDYLLTHELCHTRHMNHSAAFWRLVASHAPDFRAHEAVLNRGREIVPEWFLRDLYRD